MVAINPNEPPHRGLWFDGRISVGSLLVCLTMLGTITLGIVKGTNMYDDLVYNQKVQDNKIEGIRADVSWLRAQVLKAQASR